MLVFYPIYQQKKNIKIKILSIKMKGLKVFVLLTSYSFDEF